MVVAPDARVHGARARAEVRMTPAAQVQVRSGVAPARRQRAPGDGHPGVRVVGDAGQRLVLQRPTRVVRDALAALEGDELAHMPLAGLEP